MKKLIPIFALAAIAVSGTCSLSAQEPQAPPPVKSPEPAAGAGNGPHPGPAQTPAVTGAHGASNKSGGDFGQKFFGLSKAPDPALVAAGQKLFVANCAFCHGSNANGGNSGPNLVRSVLVLHDEGTGTQIGPVVLNGRVEKGMPKFPFNQDQVLAVSAFLLNRTQSTVNRMEYKTQNINTGDAASGKDYFSANCAGCHSATKDLAHVSTKYEPEALLARMLYPETKSRGGSGASPDPKTQSTVTVTPASGTPISGTLTYLDDFTVSMVDAHGEPHSWSTDMDGLQVQVKNPLQAHADLLPKYTDADMHNVFAYLETLK